MSSIVIRVLRTVSVAQTLKVGITALLMTALVACDGNGTNGTPETRPILTTPVVPAPPPAPLLPPAATGKTRILVTLRNAATGAPLSAGTVVLADDQNNVLDTSVNPIGLALTYNGTVLAIDLNEARLSDLDKDGLLETPANIRFSVKSDGFVTTTSELPVTRVGDNAGFINLVSFTQPPAGVGVGVMQADAKAAPITVVAETNATGNTPTRSVQFELPQGVQLISDNGTLLNSEKLKLVVSVFDSGVSESLQSFPGGFTASIANVPDLMADNPNAPVSNRGTINFQSAGFVSVEIQDDRGNLARQVVGGQSASVRITINPDTVNPDTGKPVVAGDTVPYWSLDTVSGNWQFERNLTVQKDATGELFAEFDTTHFSYFNLDWFSQAGTCNVGRINIKRSGTNVNLDSEGEFLFSSSSSSRSISYTQNDGFLALYNVPSDLVDISFRTYNGNQQLDTRMITRFTGSGTVQQGFLRNVSLCDAATNGSTIEIDAPSTPPEVSIYLLPFQSPSSYFYGNVEGNPLTFRLNLSKPSTQQVTVRYRTTTPPFASSIATPGTDFNAVSSGEIVIPAGQTSAMISVATIDDSAIEANESLALEIVSATNAAFGRIGALATGDIINNDLPSITVSTLVITEGDDNVTSGDLVASFDTPFPFDLYGQVNHVGGNANEATEYLDYHDGGINNTFVYFPQGSTSVVLKTVQVLGDRDVEPDEKITYGLTFFGFDGVFTLPDAVKNPSVTIRDNGDQASASAPVITVGGGPFDLDNNRVGEGYVFIANNFFYNSFPVQIRLSSAATTPVSVRLRTVAGSAMPAGVAANPDFDPFDQVITFQPGEASKLIFVSLFDDAVPELDESFQLQLSDVSGGVSNAQSNKTITIADNDQYYVYYIDPYFSNLNEGATSTINAYIYPAPPQDVSLTVGNSSFFYGGTQADVIATSLPLQVTVPANSNAFTFSIQAASNNTVDNDFRYGYLSIDGNIGGIPVSTNYFAVGVIDDDQVTVGLSGGQSADEGQNLNFQIVLSQPVNRDVTVLLDYSSASFSTSNTPLATQGSDFNGPQSITVPSGVTFFNFTIPVTLDTVSEGAERIVVTLLPDPNQNYLVNEDTAPTSTTGNRFSEGTINPSGGGAPITGSGS